MALEGIIMQLFPCLTKLNGPLSINKVSSKFRVSVLGFVVQKLEQFA